MDSWRRKSSKSLEHLNNFNPDPRFTSEISVHQTNFLDVIAKLQENEFLTDLDCNKTECHQYLQYDSCHPEHIKKSSVSSQGLRIKRLCENHSKNLNGFMRGYPENIVNNQLKRVKNESREEFLRP